MEWTTGNYGITTTSSKELLLVLQDVFDQLNGDASTLKATDQELKEWHKDAERLEGLTSNLARPKQWPAETTNTGHPRSVQRQAMWLQGLAKQNRELREAGERPLMLAEAVALCMYTGPLFLGLSPFADPRQSLLG